MLGLYNNRMGRLFAESIAHQTEEFGRELEAIYSDIRDHYVKSGNRPTTPLEELVERLENAIFDRTGILVHAVTNQHLAAIMPLYSHPNHVLAARWFRGEELDIPDQRKFIKNALDKKGYVDTENARVSGVFSEYEHELYMNFEALFGFFKLSAAHIAAITLHEIGHGFTFIQTAHLTTSVNQVMTRVAKEMFGQDAAAKVPYIVKELKLIDKNVTDKEVEEMLAGNRTIACMRLFKKAYGSVVSQLPNERYDDTSSEQLADSFATRFQYGKQLAEALVLMHKASGDAATSKFFYTTMRFTEAVMLLVFLASPLIIAANVGLGVLLLCLGPLMAWVNNSEVRDMTYDDLWDRLTRVRNEQIARLKRVDLTEESKKATLAQIDDLQAMIDSLIRYRPALNIIGDLFSSRARQARRTVQEQRELEDLVHNELFVISNRV